jgi:uncharacterized protein (DUF1330 family)
MATPSVFFQIHKVDEAKRLVYGRAADETPDLSGEVFDYETSKPYFKAWSEEVQKDSGGKSLGNVRSMHGKVAAGKLVDMQFDDVAKAIDICSKVVDDNEWQKVLEGVHTGYSIGGSYVKRWDDPVAKGTTRYTADPSEISLVDRPCNPGALFFDVQKADGTVLQKSFQHQPVVTGEQIGNEMERMLKDGTLSLADMMKALKGAELAKKDYTDKERKEMADKGEAMPDGSFPIKNKADLENAVEAHGRAKDPDAAKEHIKTRAKALGAEDQLPDDWKDGGKGKEPTEADKAAAAGKLKKDDTMLPVPSVGNMVNLKFGDSTAQGVITENIENKVSIQMGDLFVSVDASSLKHVAADTGPVTWNINAMPTKFSQGQLLKAAGAALEKGMYGVGCFARILADIEYLHQDQSWEEDFEGDDSTMPDQLKAWLGAGGKLLMQMVGEEVAELAGGGMDPGDEPIVIELSEHAKGLIKLASDSKDAIAKAGARHSAADMENLQKAHDALNELGATCNSDCVPHDDAARPAGGDNSTDGFEAGEAAEAGKAVAAIKGGLSKAVEAKLDDALTKMAEMTEQLSKTAGERDSLLQQLTKVNTDYAALAERLKKVEDSPAAPRGKLMVVGKGEDYVAADGSSAGSDDLNRFLIRDDKGNVDAAASVFKAIQSARGAPSK